MRLSELLEGQRFRTRLTDRTGTVTQHSERGVLVNWDDNGILNPMTREFVYLHPEVIVDGIE